MKPEITQEFLKSVINYNEQTGIFTWLERPSEMFDCSISNRAWRRWNNRYAGKKAGCVGAYGYWQLSINNVRYKAHRLAFLYFHGIIPKEIDHIDHDPLNNRISNLRGVSHRSNQRNQKLHNTNTSGTVGVCWDITINKWKATIYVDGKSKHLGTTESKDEAIRFRKEAEHNFNYHQNHGKEKSNVVEETERFRN